MSGRTSVQKQKLQGTRHGISLEGSLCGESGRSLAETSVSWKVNLERLLGLGLVEYLYMHKVLGLIHYGIKLGMVADAYNLSAWEVEAERLKVEGYLWLQSKVEANLYYMRACCK